MSVTTAPLSIADVNALGQITQWLLTLTPVSRTAADGHVVHAVPRRIVKSAAQPVMPEDDDDVRDCSLWVVTKDGWDIFWPIRDCVRDIIVGSLRVS